MPNTQHQSTIFIILHTILFYIWIFFLKEDEFLILVGSDFFILVAAVVGFIWLYKKYHITYDNFKYFWLMLSMGVGCSVVAEAICIYYRLILQSSLPYPSWADAFWLLQCILFLIALIMKMGLLENFYPMTRFFFNILIIMTVATSLSWKFLISPNLSFSSENFMSSSVSMSYSILNLVILFAAISLYFIAQHSINKFVLSLIAISVFIKILADSVYVYEFMKSIFVIGDNWFAPLWSVSLLLIGFTGLSTKAKGKVTPLKTNNKHGHDKSNIFTYISVILLLVLVVFLNPTMTEIDIGFLITFFLILIRQIVTLTENEKLSVGLEKEVEQRTVELHTALEKMERLANYDALTGLPNRNMIFKYLDERIKRCNQNGSKLTLMFLDLDRFKIVNDMMGHEAGDLLLIDVSNRLKHTVRKGDIVARQGGDEFIIVLDGVNHNEATLVAQQIITNFAPAFHLKGKEFFTTPSIGISIYPDDAQNREDLIKSADIAMYQSKEQGKNTYQFYSSISDSVNRKLMLENGLRSAIRNKELFLKYQPQIDLNTHKFVGVEALLRWEHPTLGRITPDEFIPIAEETGLIIPIGKWVLQKACHQNKIWQEDGYPPMKIAVNISPLQFRDPNFINDMKEILQQSRLEPSLLEVEITESLMQNIMESKKIIKELKKLGVSISIDDFGTGYSSLTVLNQLPIDRVKIDRAFIHDMLANANTGSLVKSIIEMGYNLNFELVAEGIEKEEQVRTLKHLKCQIGQGFLYSPPVNVEEMEKLLDKQTPLL